MINKKVFSNLLFVFLFLILSFTIAYFQKPHDNIENGSFEIQYVYQPDNYIRKNDKYIYYVWATWCSVCKVNKTPLALNHKIALFFGFNFISLEEGENLQELKQFISENQPEYPVGILSPEIDRSFNIKEYPSYVYIYGNQIKFKDTGIVNPLSFLLRILYIKLFS